MQFKLLIQSGETTHCEAFLFDRGVWMDLGWRMFRMMGRGLLVFSSSDVGLAWLFHIERVVSVKESVNRLLTC